MTPAEHMQAASILATGDQDHDVVAENALRAALHLQFAQVKLLASLAETARNRYRI